MIDKIYRKLVDELCEDPGVRPYQAPVPSLKIFLYYLEVKIDAQEFNYSRGLFQSTKFHLNKNYRT